MHRLLHLLPPVFLFVFQSFISHSTSQTMPSVTCGILLLNSWNFESHGVVSCNRNWEYYPDRLLEPNDFSPSFLSNVKVTYADPGICKNMKTESLENTDSVFATYRLIITGIDTVSSKALRIECQTCAYRLWIDGVEYCRSGVISRTPSRAKSRSGIDIIAFHPHKKQVEIILQECSLWYTYSGNSGIGPIFLGNESQVRNGQDKHWIFSHFLVTALLIVGFYNIINYLNRRKDRCPLYFGLFCLLLSINMLVSASSGWLFQLLNDSFSGQLLYRIDVITIMMSIPCFVMFLYSFYPMDNYRFVLRLSQIITGLFIVFATVLSNKALSVTFELFFTVIITMIIYSLVVSIHAVVKKRPDSVWILSGIVLMSLAGINDVLWGMGILHTPILVPSATLIFVMIYSVLISRRFSRAFADAEQLSEELVENQRLREKMMQHVRKEQDLRQIQRRLTELLHTVDEPMCAVYDTDEIVFCNRAFEELAGLKIDQMSGKLLENVLSVNEQIPDVKFDPKLSEKKEKLLKWTATIDSHGKSTICEVIKIPLELEDEQLSVMIFKVPEINNASSISIISFIDALNTNRERIQSIEDVLRNATPDVILVNPELNRELKTIDRNLEQIGRLLVDDKKIETKKKLGSEILNLSIQYWTECTGKTKTDLARESDLWKVHINQDGWERAKTLDRYLDSKTFPSNPRWNHITKTADYVLVRFSTDSSLRRRLEEALQQLQIIS